MHRMFWSLDVLNVVNARQAVAASCFLAAASVAHAQSTGDSARGMRLFNNTATESQIANLPNCTNCHMIGALRTTITANGGLTFANAMTRFKGAVAANSGGAMMMYNAFSATDVNDVSAYLANLPSVAPSPGASVSGLTYTSAAVGTATVPQTVTLSNATGAGAALGPISVAISGANAADFSISANACQGMTLAAGTSCAVSVVFTPTATGSRVATLAFTHNANPATTPVSLSGSVQSATPAAPPPAESSGGGGAVDLHGFAVWLFLLLPFVRRSVVRSARADDRG